MPIHVHPLIQWGGPMRRILSYIFAVILFCGVSGFAATGTAEPQKSKEHNEEQTLQKPNTDERKATLLSEEIRHQLLQLPYYGVFDWLSGEVRPDGTVILDGEVVRPTTKSDAEKRVKKVEGVTEVVNNIEVLPLSMNDDQIRRATYRA